MYRTPRDPGGFPFGYNWRATGLGLVMLVGFNSLATQYIAAKFLYQPALGRPLVRLNRSAIYQPFAWCIWGFQNCTSRDDRVKKPLFEGEMIVLGGCILSMVAFFVAANRRAQRLSENAEDLHGSARLARPEDLEATGIMGTEGGVYVGGWYNNSSRRLQYLRHNGPEHVLAFAPTRSGKGVGLVIPTLLAWDDSAVIYDIKCENWAKTAGFRASRGQVCFKFSPVEDGTSFRFNPLAEVRLFTPRDVSDAQNIADMIIRSGEDRRDNVWYRDLLSKLKPVGLEWATFQVLRRTNASLSRRAMIDDKVAGDQRGHGLGVSLEIYSISGVQQKIDAAKRLESEVIQ
jgi:type IV secretion system protein VirD4